MTDYLIIGAGMTADAAARGIRKHDATGSIVIIGAEADPPYNRPPLSKALWKGDPLESVWRRTPEVHGVELHLGRRVVRLDPAAMQVTDDAGKVHGARKILLATGGTPRRLADSDPGVIYFRTLKDFRSTRAAVDRKARFVVIGGGFIGAEMAAALRMQDRDVIMLQPDQGVGARVFPADLSAFVADYYRQKGVDLRSGTSVERVTRSGTTFTVHLKGGGQIEADAVLAGLGIEPAVALAAEAGIGTANGITVNRFCETSAAGVYAAGDVASFENPALGRRIRVEHEDNANTMGDVAGQNMTGAGIGYDHLPFFYSDLFDLGYEAVGEVDSRHEMVADWKEPFREGVVYYLDAGRVRGVLLWNVWGRVDEARALIGEPGPFAAANLKGRIAA